MSDTHVIIFLILHCVLWLVIKPILWRMSGLK